jgi:hypothetical protein
VTTIQNFSITQAIARAISRSTSSSTAGKGVDRAQAVRVQHDFVDSTTFDLVQGIWLSQMN